jgi:hypothetical protein
MYRVILADRYGEIASYEAATIFEALTIAGNLRRPQTVVQVVNDDRADYDTNGLTDEEREQLEAVL